MTGSDLHAALEPVVQALEAAGARYYVGGSVASSTHGVPRSSLDADVLAELDEASAARVVELLGDAFYADASRARDAARRKASFNVIHLATMFKVDIFVSRGRAFDASVLDRAQPHGAWRVASAEDVVLLKLEWYRRGGEVSERQWTDVIGVLRAASPLEDTYLDRWAADLGLVDLLARARMDAGVTPP